MGNINRQMCRIKLGGKISKGMLVPFSDEEMARQAEDMIINQKRVEVVEILQVGDLVANIFQIPQSVKNKSRLTLDDIPDYLTYRIIEIIDQFAIRLDDERVVSPHVLLKVIDPEVDKNDQNQ